MFFDQAKVYIKSGTGGDGMISFRREKHVPLGGPDGGDGGNGGDIIFFVDKATNSLVKYHRNVHHRAGDGVNGGRVGRTGARGETLRLPVPPGTLIRDATTGDILADLTLEGQEALMLTGGRGGKGNTHYATSRNQAPRLAERGGPSEDLWLHLELKLIADVGLVGLPNAGKSTLLSVISGATPKIAAYPFTTLQPSLGVVDLGNYETIIVADIPGLIEGAAEGIGLGHEFLRHIERTRVLIHLIDGSDKEPLENWAIINQELALYNTTLGIKLDERPQLVVFNKMDLPDAIAWEPLIEEEVVKAGYEFISISALTKQNLREMLYKIKGILDEAPEYAVVDESEIVIRATGEDDSFTIEREADGWRVYGQKIERIAAMTYFEFESTATRFSKTLENMGITKALEEAGIEVGEYVYIGEEELEWTE